jgi:hypothetical protein
MAGQGGRNAALEVFELVSERVGASARAGAMQKYELRHSNAPG